MTFILLLNDVYMILTITLISSYNLSWSSRTKYEITKDMNR